MKLGRKQFSNGSMRTVAAAAIAAAIAFAAMPVAAAPSAHDSGVESHIASMHAKLGITVAEEGLWTKVADVMRDNAKEMDQLNSARMTNAKTMNAVDDLKSYGEITDVHADEIKKFTAAFAALYAEMSDAQKVQADNLFRHGQKHAKSTPAK